MSTFKQMRDRIASDLRRTNINSFIGNAINDAVTEAAKTRFWFNEVLGQSFVTVPGTEYYDDMGLTEIDAIYYLQGATRYNLTLRNQLDENELASGNPVLGGQLTEFSRAAGKLRLYPIPNSIITIYVDGFGKLQPSPYVNDNDTNAWLNDAELYIRALAKRNVTRDVIRDYGEASIMESIAEDYKNILLEETARKSSTGTIRSTAF